MRLCDCDTNVWFAPEVVDAAGPVAEVVEEVEPVGSGRRLKLEVGRDDERDGLLVVVEDDLELEPEEAEGVDEEGSDELVVVASTPLTAQAQMGVKVACCKPQAKPVHELDRESSSY
jgi:hypothetical protein